MRLLVVDSHWHYWKRARPALARGRAAEVAVWSASGSDALADPGLARIDAAVVDIESPDISTLSLIGHVAEELEKPVIALCDSADDAHLGMAFSADAVACVGRDEGPEALAQALLAVSRGETPLRSELARRPELMLGLMGELKRRLRATDRAGSRPDGRGGTRRTGHSPLTEREATILGMVADGLLYKEIGAALDITERTVKSHMSRAVEKLDARSRAHALRVAIESGWICTGRDEDARRLEAAL